jgi:hypothetical protein
MFDVSSESHTQQICSWCVPNEGMVPAMTFAGWQLSQIRVSLLRLLASSRLMSSFLSGIDGGHEIEGSVSQMVLNSSPRADSTDRWRSTFFGTRCHRAFIWPVLPIRCNIDNMDWFAATWTERFRDGIGTRHSVIPQEKRISATNK